MSNTPDIKPNWAAYLSLFGSASTLICCALPAVVVTLAGGAAMISLTTAVPQLIWLSEHKLALFIISGLMLAVAGYWQWRQRYAPCPIDPVQAAACTRLRRINLGVYLFSLLMFVIGFSFAFIIPRFM